MNFIVSFLILSDLSIKPRCNRRCVFAHFLRAIGFSNIACRKVCKSGGQGKLCVGPKIRGGGMSVAFIQSKL